MQPSFDEARLEGRYPVVLLFHERKIPIPSLAQSFGTLHHLPILPEECRPWIIVHELCFRQL